MATLWVKFYALVRVLTLLKDWLVWLITASFDFETAFTGVEKTVDATTEQFDELRKNIIGMSKEIPVAFEELARLGESWWQLWVGIENIEAFIDTTARIWVSTNLASAEAATAFARISNIVMNQSQMLIEWVPQ